MNLVTRRQWGARLPACSTPLTSGVRGLAVHYSASDADEQADHQNCAARVQAIQRYHMDTQGWCDIAYSHLFCVHGYVYAGRGFGKRTAANGTNPGNSHYFAACFLGNDDEGQDVTPEARDALVELRQEYLRRYPNARETVGHRDITSTACPGDELYAFIRSRSFKAAVEGLGPLPGPSPKPEWFWRWGDWRLTPMPRGPRPDGLPRIPAWAWAALEEWQRRH